MHRERHRPVAAYTAVELRERIRTLEEGLVQVARGVQFSDRGVTYNSASELRERIEYFRQKLASLTGARRKQSKGIASKGIFD